MGTCLEKAGEGPCEQAREWLVVGSRVLALRGSAQVLLACDLFSGDPFPESLLFPALTSHWLVDFSALNLVIVMNKHLKSL